MQQAEEELLIIAAQAGNQKAFALIYKNYQQSLLRFAFQLCGNSDLAQDAVQEAWIFISKNLRKVHDPRAMKSWVYQQVRWRTLDLIRKNNKNQQVNEEFEESKCFAESEYIADSISTENNELENENSLLEAIKKLPPTEKQMIYLFYLDELKIVEIAEILNIPNGTVKSRLNRARKLLKQKFDFKY